ncbi:Rap guanine nucleotide exchange factor 4, partial [Araneus ventricosus]
RVIFKDSEVSVPTGLSVNGRIFLTRADEVDLLTPLPEQDGPSDGTAVILETLNSLDIAYNMTVYEWDLFSCVHESNTSSVQVQLSDLPFSSKVRGGRGGLVGRSRPRDRRVAGSKRR